MATSLLQGCDTCAHTRTHIVTLLTLHVTVHAQGAARGTTGHFRCTCCACPAAPGPPPFSCMSAGHACGLAGEVDRTRVSGWTPIEGVAVLAVWLQCNNGLPSAGHAAPAWPVMGRTCSPVKLSRTLAASETQPQRLHVRARATVMCVLRWVRQRRQTGPAV